MIDFAATFMFFFAVIDPIGTVPVFIAVTSGNNEADNRAIAIKAALYSAGILTFFVFAGEQILTYLDIPLSAFQISGGIILFLFALTMIFGESKPEEERQLAKGHEETAIYPLAVPSIAGPGAMLAAVLATERARFSFSEQLQTLAMLLLVILLTLILMLFASHINKVIGRAGASVVSRVMGMILAALAATSVLRGVETYFQL